LAAGNAETQGDITRTIHGNAAHPAMVAIRSISALLLNAPAAPAVAQFVPANARLSDRTSSSVHSVIRHQRLMCAEIAILQAEH
jgi:hypothetical protein